MLIERCLCGAADGDALQVDELELVRCDCGVIRLQSELTPDEYFEQYRGAYHAAADRHPGCVPYAKRYAHDVGVAAKRWRRYAQLLGRRLDYVRSVLDVGVGNGAFVDFLRVSRGLQAWGVDPDPAMARGPIRCGVIADVSREVDLVTYHDVLEHVLDPYLELEAARARCRRLIVVDVPDVSVEAGRHHFKAEHPWYFTPDALELLLAAAGFDTLAFDRPVPGKLVAYARAA